MLLKFIIQPQHNGEKRNNQKSKYASLFSFKEVATFSGKFDNAYI